MTSVCLYWTHLSLVTDDLSSGSSLRMTRIKRSRFTDIVNETAIAPMLSVPRHEVDTSPLSDTRSNVNSTRRLVSDVMSLGLIGP